MRTIEELKTAYIAGDTFKGMRGRRMYRRLKEHLQKREGTVVFSLFSHKGMDEQERLRHRFSTIEGVDIVYFLPDWKKDWVARREREYCVTTGKSMCYAKRVIGGWEFQKMRQIDQEKDA